MRNNRKDNIIREQVKILGHPPIEMLKREIARQERNESYRKLARDILIYLVAIAAVITVITNQWLAVLQIDGSSMNPLLQTDEIVFAVRNSDPMKNDIIAFFYNGNLHVKRVIAIAGDIVNIDDNGVASVNGKTIDEPYVTELSLGNCDITFPFLVPTGTVFVMGDNRPVSLDSRNSRFGPVSRDQIIGKTNFRLWPLSRIGSFSKRINNINT